MESGPIHERQHGVVGDSLLYSRKEVFYWVKASIRLPFLQLLFEIAKLNVNVNEHGEFILNQLRNEIQRSSETAELRPCVVLSANNETGVATVCLLTTFRGSAYNDIDLVYRERLGWVPTPALPVPSMSMTPLPPTLAIGRPFYPNRYTATGVPKAQYVLALPCELLHSSLERKKSSYSLDEELVEKLQTLCQSNKADVAGHARVSRSAFLGVWKQVFAHSRRRSRSSTMPQSSSDSDAPGRPRKSYSFTEPIGNIASRHRSALSNPMGSFGFVPKLVRT